MAETWVTMLAMAGRADCRRRAGRSRQPVQTWAENMQGAGDMFKYRMHGPAGI